MSFDLSLVASLKRLEKVKAQVTRCQEESAVLNAEWQVEKERLGRMKQHKAALETATLALEQARRAGDYQKAGELMHQVIPTLKMQVSEGETETGVLLSDAVTSEHVAHVVARATVRLIGGMI